MGYAARGVVLVAAACVLPCCFILTSTDGLSGGPEADLGDAADTGANPTLPPEGGKPGPDAGEAGAGDSGLGCVAYPGATFCADFDKGTLEQGWDALGTGVGTFALDDKASVSPQRSLLVTLPITTDYAEGVVLKKIFNATFTSLSCSFAMRRDVIGVTRVTFFNLEVETSGDTLDVLAGMRPNESDFIYNRYPADGGPRISDDVPAGLNFEPNVWHQVTIEVTRTSARLLIDGTLAGMLAHGLVQAPFRANLSMGGVEMDTANTAPWKFRFDDVRCTVTP